MADSFYDRDATALKYLKRFGLIAVAILAVSTLSLGWLLHTQSGAAWVVSKAQSSTNEALQVNRVAGDLSSGLVLSDTTWQADGSRILAKQIKARASFGIFPLRLQLSDVIVSDGYADLLSQPANDEPDAIDVDGVLDSLRLPLKVSIDRLQLRNIMLRRDGEPSVKLDSLNLSADWHDAVSVREFSVKTDLFSASGTASIDLQEDRPIFIVINIAASGFGEHAIRVQGSGRGEEYSLTELTIDGEWVKLEGNAGLSWGDAGGGDKKTLSLDISFSQLQLHELVPSWPAEHPLSGELVGVADESQLNVSHLKLVAANSAAQLQGSGSYTLSNEQIAGSVEWQQLQWPVNAELPNVFSDTATLQLAGTLDLWSVDGDLHIGTASTPEGAFRFRANGDRDRATINISEGEIVGGTVSGEADYSWRNTQAWSADLRLQNIAVGEINSDWPGFLSGRVAASGSVQESTADLRLFDVAGELRGRSLNASGGLGFAAETVVADDFRVSYGRSSARLFGAPESSSGLRFSLDVGELNEFHADAYGGLRASGNYSNAGQYPRLSVDVSSDALKFADIELANLKVSDSGDSETLFSAELTADSLILGGREFAAVTVNTSIRETGQFADLNFKIDDAQVQLALGGALDDFDEGIASTWRGQLLAASIDATENHQFSLDRAAGIVLSQQRIAIEQACLDGSLGSRICADGNWQLDGDTAGQWQLQSLPLSIVDQFMSTELEMNQEVSGQVEWQYDRQNSLTANGNFSLTAGRLQSLRSKELSMETGIGYADFSIENGALLAGTLKLPLPGNGAIDGDFAIEDLATGAQSPIRGNMSIAISDISMLAHFSPLMDTAGGNLQAKMTLAGSVSDMQVSGDIEMTDGELEYLPIGLDLSEINLQAELRADGNTDLHGTFRAGDGVGRVTSAARYLQGEALSLNFSIQGERLTLINVPELTAVVNTDLNVAYVPQQLTLDGNVLVDEARVRPTSLVSGAVVESDDVEIIAGELPEASDTQEDDDDLQIFGDLTVTLGDDVSFDVSVARASASGSADFNWTGDVLPMANGRYDLRGEVQAYGQVLDITEGRVRFSDVPADNPYLRIRAEREIFGNTQVKKAGVFIDGYAKNPRVETYTAPLTTEERALTLLATGSDFDFEQGVGAVDFGTYIAPRLFVAYGVSLFGRDNVISARYDLSKGFGIKATSGSKESGVDLNYRFEN